jgi:hypothetical protein
VETNVHFREVQQFRQLWLWGLFALSALVVLTNLPRGKRSSRETVRGLLGLGAAALLLRVARLSTEVRGDGVYVRFAPFHRSYRKIAFADLTDVQATGYSPLRYGGWAIRWSPSGVAYTVSGKSGVRLERAGGRSVLVGSDDPDELLAAVQDASEREV